MDKMAANWWALRSKQLRYWYNMSASYAIKTNAWLIAEWKPTWRVNLQDKCFEVLPQ